MATIPFNPGGGSGVDIVDSGGNVVSTVDNIPSKNAQTYTPSTVNQVIDSGQYLNGDQTILGDGNLIASNIRSGVNIFGVVGNLIDRVTGRILNPRWWG